MWRSSDDLVGNRRTNVQKVWGCVCVLGDALVCERGHEVLDVCVCVSV